MAAAREDLATARERLRRSQDEDLATAMSDLAASREETATVAAERDSLDARLQQELDARRAADKRTAAAQRETADARNAAAGLREAIRVGQAKAAADIEEAISVAEAAAAETRAVVHELEAANCELGNVREQLEEAYAGRRAMTEAVEVAREESDALKEHWRAADDEVGGGKCVYSKHPHEHVTPRASTVTMPSLRNLGCVLYLRWGANLLNFSVSLS